MPTEVIHALSVIPAILFLKIKTYIHTSTIIHNNANWKQLKVHQKANVKKNCNILMH